MTKLFIWNITTQNRKFVIVVSAKTKLNALNKLNKFMELQQLNINNPPQFKEVCEDGVWYSYIGKAK